MHVYAYARARDAILLALGTMHCASDHVFSTTKYQSSVDDCLVPYSARVCSLEGCSLPAGIWEGIGLDARPLGLSPSRTGLTRLIVLGHWCSRYAADYKEKEKLHHRF